LNASLGIYLPLHDLCLLRKTRVSPNDCLALQPRLAALAPGIQALGILLVPEAATRAIKPARPTDCLVI
jgi:hypothetical protein